MRGWVVCLALLAMPIHAAAPPDLHWLAGCWQRLGTDSDSLEVWLPMPSAGRWLGLGYQDRADGGFHEFLEIREQDGQWVYRAHVPGQDVTDFRLQEQGDDWAAFINPDHDYPQRIEYRRRGEGLEAQISRLDGAQTKSWSWQRISCEDALSPIATERPLPPDGSEEPGQ